MTNRDLDWEHYPENDQLPEHYSSPFALVIHELDHHSQMRWVGYVLNTAVTAVRCPEEITVYKRIGEYSMPNHAKGAILNWIEQNSIIAMPRARAAAA